MASFQWLYRFHSIPMNIGSFPLQLVRYKFLRGMVITSAKLVLWCCKGLWKIQLQFQIRRHFFEIHDVVSWQRDKSFRIKWIPQNVRYGIPCYTQSLHKLCHKIDASDSITLMDKQWRRGYINIYIYVCIWCICSISFRVIYSLWCLFCKPQSHFRPWDDAIAEAPWTKTVTLWYAIGWLSLLLILVAKKSEWMAHHNRLTRLASSLTT